MNFNKTAKFFIGVDSDGTIFDSMNVKHTLSFIPCMIKVWKLEKFERDVFKVAERINLYSKERGINRFPGLVRTFDELNSICKGKFPLMKEEYNCLRYFCESDLPMSNDGLIKYMENHNEKFLEEVLLWSRESDRIFREKMKNMPPYEKGKKALETLHNSVDFCVISSASQSAIEHDWKKWDILKYVSFAAGQEYGLKSQQIEKALKNGYSKNCALMIGDALGDLEAAKKNGIYFYGIIPGKENESWEKFQKVYFPYFIEGKFDMIQNDLVNDFEGYFR